MPSLFLLLDAGQSSWRIIIGAYIGRAHV